MSLDVNFNESLTNDVVSFEQLGPEVQSALPLHCDMEYLITVNWWKACWIDWLYTLIRIHLFQMRI